METLSVATAVLALGALGVLVVLARRPRLSTVNVKLVGRVALDATHSLFVVEAEGRRVLLGAGPAGGLSLLGELSSPSVVNQVDSPEAKRPSMTPSQVDFPAVETRGVRPTQVESPPANPPSQVAIGSTQVDFPAVAERGVRPTEVDFPEAKPPAQVAIAPSQVDSPPSNHLTQVGFPPAKPLSQVDVLLPPQPSQVDFSRALAARNATRG